MKKLCAASLTTLLVIGGLALTSTPAFAGNYHPNPPADVVTESDEFLGFDCYTGLQTFEKTVETQGWEWDGYAGTPPTPWAWHRRWWPSYRYSIRRRARWRRGHCGGEVG